MSMMRTRHLRLETVLGKGWTIGHNRRRPSRVGAHFLKEPDGKIMQFYYVKVNNAQKRKQPSFPRKMAASADWRATSIDTDYACQPLTGFGCFCPALSSSRRATPSGVRVYVLRSANPGITSARAPLAT